MLSIGMSDWPPASTFALSSFDNMLTASSTVRGSWYRNDGGFIKNIASCPVVSIFVSLAQKARAIDSSISTIGPKSELAPRLNRHLDAQRVRRQGLSYLSRASSTC